MTEQLHFHFFPNFPAEHLSEVQLSETVLIEGPNEWGPPLLEAQESPLEQQSPRESLPPARLRFEYAAWLCLVPHLLLLLRDSTRQPWDGTCISCKDALEHGYYSVRRVHLQ